MTDQEAYDTALAHLREQGARCYSDTRGGGCLYRGPDGRKCAIGALIPDGMVEFDRETRHGTANSLPVVDLVSVSAEVFALFEGVDTTLLEALQSLHDTALSWDFGAGFVGENEAEGIAIGHGLDYSPPNNG